MWVLTPQPGDAHAGVVYHLLADRTYDVGRKDNDILISNDKSISRKHATLSVRLDDAGESTLWVTGAKRTLMRVLLVLRRYTNRRQQHLWHNH